MNKIFAAAAIGTLIIVSAFADSYFRVDVMSLKKGKEVKISSPAVKEANIKLVPMSWMKENQKPCTLTGDAKITDKDGWKTMTFTVKAEKDTTVTVSFRGGWAANPAQMTWVYVTDLKLDGKLVSNGDFSQKRNGSGIPLHFWMDNPRNFIPAEKTGDKNAALVFHNAGIGREFDLQAGKIYIFSVLVKAANVPHATVKK